MGAQDQKTAVPGKLSKKQARKEVFIKLSGALADYKESVSKKKFERKLKKASKLFAVDIAKASKKIKKTSILPKAISKIS